MSQYNPEFSIVIPNYNNGKTLRRAIISALSQSYRAKEIIVIDDGSTDNSKEVALEFNNSVQYIYQDNAGVSAARNLGARLATGDWLAFLDADDCYFPDRLQAHASWIKKEPAIDFLLGDQELRTPEGKTLRLTISECQSGKLLLSRYPDAQEIPILQTDFEKIIGDGFFEIRTLSVPRKKFAQLGGFPVGKKIGEDLHFFIRLCAISKKGGVVASPLAVYYIYPDSVMRKDVISSQYAFISTLNSLKKEEEQLPSSIKRGIDCKIKNIELGLAYTLLRKNRKLDAILSIIPSLWKRPGIESIKETASIIRGYRTKN